MSVESKKAHSFVQHLFSNPVLQQYTPLQREEQIRQFLEVNSQALQPTLTSGGFFPGFGWDRIVEMLMSTARERTDKLFYVDIRDFIGHKINFDFLKDLGIETVNFDQMEDQMLSVINQMLTIPQARAMLSGCYVAALYNLFVRYLQHSYSRKAYVYFELTKVQKIGLSLEKAFDLLKVVLLLAPVVWVVAKQQFHLTTDNTQPLDLTQELVDATSNYLTQSVPLLPESMYKSIIHTSASFTEDKDIEAISRVASIFASRGKNYQSNIKHDRGAESPDKSWFYIARRNHRYYGYDSKMLEEFYSIAADEVW